jgi:hypothetical protein
MAMVNGEAEALSDCHTDVNRLRCTRTAVTFQELTFFVEAGAFVGTAFRFPMICGVGVGVSVF